MRENEASNPRFAVPSSATYKVLALANGKEVQLISGEGVGQVVGLSPADAQALRDQSNAWLTTAANDLGQLANEFLPIGMDVLANLDVVPIFPVRPKIRFGRRGFTLGYFHAFPDLTTAMKYAVMLLLDVTKPFGAALCRCQLISCAQFYLARQNPKGGRPNRKYCCPEHAVEANNRKLIPRKHK